MSRLGFHQVDVFPGWGGLGNPVAVVHDADGLSTETKAAFANWTNLSETTFLLRPTDAGADYRARIFTPGAELPFAGHPTLGSAAAWLAAGGTPRDEHGRIVVQESGIGLVSIAVRDDSLAFAAPELLRSGAVEEHVRDQVLASLGPASAAVRDLAWIDNGPGWIGVELASAADVLALAPDLAVMGELVVAVIGAFDVSDPHRPADYEVRAFAPGVGVGEDPVTGSANAGLAQWFAARGRLGSGYVARQGTVLGRSGRVLIEPDAEGQIWIGGATELVISGTVELPER